MGCGTLLVHVHSVPVHVHLPGGQKGFSVSAGSVMAFLHAPCAIPATNNTEHFACVKNHKHWRPCHCLDQGLRGRGPDGEVMKRVLSTFCKEPSPKNNNYRVERT